MLRSISQQTGGQFFAEMNAFAVAVLDRNVHLNSTSVKPTTCYGHVRCFAKRTLATMLEMAFRISFVFINNRRVLGRLMND